jgi:hypothetical protein
VTDQQFIIALIVSLTGAMTAFGAMLSSFRNRKQIVAVSGQVTDIRIHMNSRLDEMLALRSTASHAEGRAQGHAEGAAQARHDDATAVAAQSPKETP